MDILIPHCIVTKKFYSEKSNQHFLTIEEGDSSLQISSGDLDFSKVEVLKPLKMTGKVLGFIYQGKLNLKATVLKIEPYLEPVKS